MKNEQTYFVGKTVRCRVMESKEIALRLDSYFQFVRVQMNGVTVDAALLCDRDGNPVVATGAVFDAEIAPSAFATPPYSERSCFMFSRIRHVSGLALYDHLPSRRLQFPD